ncbi:MAG: hypothetical protein IRZ13_10135 [Acetobacteraceae bacterium]|nr:hypothetical protein [Acetobacteraceae bacterium]
MSSGAGRFGAAAAAAPPPGISPTVPDPGAPRLVAGADGEPIGLEVWTGSAWLRVRDVTVMLSSHRAREPVWQTGPPLLTAQGALKTLACRAAGSSSLRHARWEPCASAARCTVAPIGYQAVADYVFDRNTGQLIGRTEPRFEEVLRRNRTPQGIER